MISVYFSLFDSTSFSTRFFQIFLPNCLIIVIVLYIIFFMKNYSITGEYRYLYKNIYQFIQKEIRTRLENNYPIISDKLAQIFIICLLWDLLGLLPYTFISTRIIGATMFFAFPYFFSRVIILNSLDIKLRVIRVVYPGFGLLGTLLFIITEIIRGAVRPFALYLRLLVNIVAGHLIDRIIIKIGPLFFSIHFYPRLCIALSYLISLHIWVAIVQAYVITTLRILFSEKIVNK